MKSKKGIIITIIVVLLLLVVGVTYAFFTYESGTKSDIVTGQIYMNYEETSTISLTGVFPETKAQVLARTDENGVFEFTITGRNTSKYPVYYEIDLLEGGVITGKTETSTKILPEHVMIYLEKDGVPVIEGKTYADWNNKSIYVETVPANQTTNIEHKYTLRMWISDKITISDTDPNADYTTSEWNDAYTSLKVRVVGDFEYKEVATDASCFVYNMVQTTITYDYPVITLDTSEEKVEACMASAMNGNGGDYSTAQDGYQSFCEGTGTVDLPFGVMTIKEYANLVMSQGVSEEEIISMLPVITDITRETRYYELNTSEESVNACKEYILRWEGEDLSDAQDGYQSFCGGNGTYNGLTILDVYDSAYDGWWVRDYRYPLIERNVFTQVEEIQGEIEITNYDETCGTEVVIPSMIGGLPIISIGEEAFAVKYITSVKLPDTLQQIGPYAFFMNDLAEVIIPDSVFSIGEMAFMSNNLSTIVLGRKVFMIGTNAFEVGTGYSGINPIEKIINKSGNAFNWNAILDAASNVTVQDPGVVATGTYIYYLNGNREIQITSE